MVVKYFQYSRSEVIKKINKFGLEYHITPYDEWSLQAQYTGLLGVEYYATKGKCISYRPFPSLATNETRYRKLMSF